MDAQTSTSASKPDTTPTENGAHASKNQTHATDSPHLEFSFRIKLRSARLKRGCYMLSDPTTRLNRGRARLKLLLLRMNPVAVRLIGVSDSLKAVPSEP